MACILDHHPLRSPRKRRVELLLGNDREIGRETHSQERRAGITPDHVRELSGFFADLRLELSVMVMQGAGQRAGFSDADFVAAGAEILTEGELQYQERPPDVVHALKEPSRYESLIQRPFCRIGALHTGDFHAEGGLAGLLRKQNVAIFDGSHIGAPDVFRIPIRGSMSVFAGEIAAEWVLDHLQYRRASGRAVVVGAGNAGLAALRKLAADPAVTEVCLLDSAEDPRRLEQIRARLTDVPKARAEGITGTDHPALLAAIDGAVAVVFAVARPREAAPKVVHVNSLKQRLADGAMVVDISIDEKGAILDPEVRRTWSLEQIIEHLGHSFAGSRNRVYRALANMPRAYPQQASTKHGEAVLPYLAALLFLAARDGGAEAAIRHLTVRSVDGRSPHPGTVEPARVLDALIQDLRNGMAFYPRFDSQQGRLGGSDTVADRASVFDFLYKQRIPFEFSALARGGAEREKAAFSVFPDPIRECLSYAVDRGVPFRMISHPGIDGTRTENAEKALGVGAEKVLKCLVFRADDRYVAAICTGRKHVLEERLRDLTQAREVHLASPDEVLKVTGHTKGGVPPVQVFATVSEVFVDEGVMRQDAVYGSAGTELAGMRIAPSALKALGARVAQITPEDGRLKRSEPKVRKLLARLERAMEEDDDAAAREIFAELGSLLEEPVPSLR